MEVIEKQQSPQYLNTSNAIQLSVDTKVLQYCQHNIMQRQYIWYVTRIHIKYSYQYGTLEYSQHRKKYYLCMGIDGRIFTIFISIVLFRHYTAFKVFDAHNFIMEVREWVLNVNFEHWLWMRTTIGTCKNTSISVLQRSSTVLIDANNINF